MVLLLLYWCSSGYTDVAGVAGVAGWPGGHVGAPPTGFEWGDHQVPADGTR